jgi:hypothetical protein
MDPPELASEPPRSRIELRAGVKSIGLGMLGGAFGLSTSALAHIDGCEAIMTRPCLCCSSDGGALETVSSTLTLPLLLRSRI